MKKINEIRNHPYEYGDLVTTRVNYLIRNKLFYEIIIEIREVIGVIVWNYKL